MKSYIGLYVYLLVSCQMMIMMFNKCLLVIANCCLSVCVVYLQHLPGL